MSITNGYATLEQFKARYFPAGVADTTDDTVIENVIEAVSRLFDHFCGRRFFVNVSDEIRYYTAEFADILFCDDIASLTSLATDEDGDRVYETTWAATDYDLMPHNAALDGRSYGWIEPALNGNYAFPVGIARGVKLVGKFGTVNVSASNATLDAINEACLLQAIRLFKRKDAPFGIAGGPEVGQLMTISKLDPDVMLLLQPFRKMTVGG